MLWKYQRPMSCRLVDEGGVARGAITNSLGQRCGVHASLPLPSSCRQLGRMIGVRWQARMMDGCGPSRMAQRPVARDPLGLAPHNNGSGVAESLSRSSETSLVQRTDVPFPARADRHEGHRPQPSPRDPPRGGRSVPWTPAPHSRGRWDPRRNSSCSRRGSIVGRRHASHQGLRFGSSGCRSPTYP